MNFEHNLNSQFFTSVNLSPGNLSLLFGLKIPILGHDIGGKMLQYLTAE